MVKGDDWDADSWNWLEMLKNMSNNGLPANYFFNVEVKFDVEIPTQHIIEVRK